MGSLKRRSRQRGTVGRGKQKGNLCNNLGEIINLLIYLKKMCQ